MGVIYILTNPSFPAYVKIGYADDLHQRLEQLNNSSAVPFSFRAYATYTVSERLTDKRLHSLIDNLNPDLRAVEEVNGRRREREFFEMKPEEAYRILEAIAEISGTKERLRKVTPSGDEIRAEQEAEEARREARRPPFTFSYVGIPAGSELVFVKDPSIRAVVHDDRHIKVRDNVITSLSGEAKHILGKNTLAGPVYWSYNGKLLSDLRDEADRKNHVI